MHSGRPLSGVCQVVRRALQRCCSVRSRTTFNSNSPIKLCVFTDACKEAYGCALYVVQDVQRHLFFSKVKVSLLKERTLPTLELLAVELAFKCFLIMFNDGLIKDFLL